MTRLPKSVVRAPPLGKKKSGCKTHTATAIMLQNDICNDLSILPVPNLTLDFLPPKIQVFKYIARYFSAVLLSIHLSQE